jgi:hypothetical protein
VAGAATVVFNQLLPMVRVASCVNHVNVRNLVSLAADAEQQQ